MKERTYSGWLVVGNEVACTLNENVCPVALLVYHTRVQALVVRPGRRWAAREALDPAEGSVLGGRHASEMVFLGYRLRLRGTYLDHDWSSTRCRSQ